VTQAASARLKRKYAVDKPTGKYKSKHNDGAKRRARPRRKLGDKERAVAQANQPLVTLVLLPTGKKTFVREPRAGH
jgi:hypothetical protein